MPKRELFKENICLTYYYSLHSDLSKHHAYKKDRPPSIYMPLCDLNCWRTPVL